MALSLNRVRSASIFPFTVTFLVIFAGKSLAQGLRPSDHGLQYQFSSPPTESHSPPGKMMSFFGDSHSPPPSHTQLLPKATAADGGDNDSWWRDGAGNRRDHVMRHVFLAASMICGISGVALLVLFTLIYFFKYRKPNRSNLPCNDLE
uniref:Transmembrane protein n=1 Tax=Noccaea caerulescens TaxID=107243 RepID=A0A1J3GML7_NOCCA